MNVTSANAVRTKFAGAGSRGLVHTRAEIRRGAAPDVRDLDSTGLADLVLHVHSVLPPGRLQVAVVRRRRGGMIPGLPPERIGRVGAGPRPEKNTSDE